MSGRLVSSAPAPAAAPAAAKQNKTKTTEKTAKPKSAMSRLKEIMISSPKLPVKDLQTQLASEGYTPAASSIASLRTDFLHSVRMLQAHGLAQELVLD